MAGNRLCDFLRILSNVLNHITLDYFHEWFYLCSGWWVTLSKVPLGCCHRSFVNPYGRMLGTTSWSTAPIPQDCFASSMIQRTNEIFFKKKSRPRYHISAFQCNLFVTQRSTFSCRDKDCAPRIKALMHQDSDAACHSKGSFFIGIENTVLTCWCANPWLHPRCLEFDDQSRWCRNLLPYLRLFFVIRKPGGNRMERLQWRWIVAESNDWSELWVYRIHFVAYQPGLPQKLYIRSLSKGSVPRIVFAPLWSHSHLPLQIILLLPILRSLWNQIRQLVSNFFLTRHAGNNSSDSCASNGPIGPLPTDPTTGYQSSCRTISNFFYISPLEFNRPPTSIGGVPLPIV